MKAIKFLFLIIRLTNMSNFAIGKFIKTYINVGRYT